MTWTAGLFRLQTTRCDYGCAAGSPPPPPPPPPFSAAARALPSPTLASAPPPSHLSRASPPLSSSPSPSTLGRFYFRVFAPRGLPQQLSTRKAGRGLMRALLQATSKEAGSAPLAIGCIWSRVLPAGGRLCGLEQTHDLEHFERGMQLLSGEGQVDQHCNFLGNSPRVCPRDLAC